MQSNQPELANMSLRQIFEATVADMTPLGGEQTPEDIGNLAVFYASDNARMITGQVVAVDGGISDQVKTRSAGGFLSSLILTHF